MQLITDKIVVKYDDDELQFLKNIINHISYVSGDNNSIIIKKLEENKVDNYIQMAKWIIRRFNRRANTFTQEGIYVGFDEFGNWGVFRCK